MARIDYTSDFLAFFSDLYVCEGGYGPRPIVPPFLASWLHAAFPAPEGNPIARNIGDFRTKKEGKSALAGAVGLYMASRKEYQEVVIAASDVDQAKDRVLRAIKFAVERGPLAAHAKVYRDLIELDNHSIIQAIPADWKGAAGGNYSCVIFDELHAWIYEWQRRLFDELVIPPTQPGGVRWIASYAGWDGESILLKEIWDRALLGEKLPGDLPIYQNKRASLLAFVDTGPASWRMPWMTPEYIAETKESERPNTYRRIWLNEWVSNESQFLPEGVWQACASSDVRPIQPGEKRRLVLGADASTSRDLTALVGVEYNRDTNTVDVALVRVWKPIRGFLRGGKPTVDLEETIGAEVKRLKDEDQLLAVVCDPYQLHSLIIEWEKSGIRVIELPQTTGRTEADQALYDACLGRAIRHYNDKNLNEHMRNAIAVESPRGYRLAKEKTTQKIDLAVALSMAHFGALDKQKAIGETEWVRDPFAEDGPRPWGYYYDVRVGKDFIECNPNWKTHAPGVTAANCTRKREFACEACVKELISIGYYKRLEKDAEFYQDNPGMSEEGFRQEWRLTHGTNPIIDQVNEKRYQARGIVKEFFKKYRKQAKGGENV